jgi:hypothetical protein
MSFVAWLLAWEFQNIGDRRDFISEMQIRDLRTVFLCCIHCPVLFVNVSLVAAFCHSTSIQSIDLTSDPEILFCGGRMVAKPYKAIFMMMLERYVTWEEIPRECDERFRNQIGSFFVLKRFFCE